MKLPARQQKNSSNLIYWLFWTVIFLTPLMHEGTPFFIVNPLYHRYFFYSVLISLIILVVLSNKGILFRLSSFEIFFMLYILINLASIFYSPVKFRSEFKFFNLSFGFIVFILGLNVVRDAKQVTAILRALVLSTTLIGILGICQGIFGAVKIDMINLLSNFGHRAQGTFENPNFFAGFLAMVIPLACYFLLFGNEKKTRICGGFSVIILGNALLWTGSRGALIAVGSTLIFLFFLLRRDRRLREVAKVAVIILVTGGLYLISASASAKVSEKPFEEGRDEYIATRYSDPGPVERRWETYKKALPMIRDHPVLGTGVNTYKYNSLKYYPGDPELLRGHAHNIFLNIAIEVGLLGLFFFGMMLLSFFRQSRFLLTRRRGYGIDSIGTFGLLGLFAFLIHNLFDYTWMPQACQIAFFLIASLIVKQRMLEQKIEDGVRTPVYKVEGKIPLICLLSVVAFLLVVSVFRPLYAFHLFERSIYLYGTNNMSQGLSYAQKAVDTMPECPLFHLNLSKFYLRQWVQDKDIKNYEKGITEIKKALSLNPTESNSHSLLGEARERFKDYSGAATAYIEAIKLNPYNISLYHKVAVNYMELKEYEPALMWLKRAVERLQEIVGEDKDVSLLLFENCMRTAIAYDELGQYVQARIYYKKTLNLVASGKIKGDTGPLRERLEYVENAIKANSYKPASQ